MKPSSRSEPPTTALHPITHVFVTSAFAVSAAFAPVESGLAIVLFAIVASSAIPRRTDTDLVGPFLRILVLAAVFLFLINGVRWNPPGITRAGIVSAAESFIHVAIPVTAVLYLSRRIRSDELYSFLVDLRVPPAAILVLFRTLWLVPRLKERMDETLTALRLRGMPSGSFVARFRTLAPSLGVVFSSMFGEISENALVATARGFLLPGRKTHLLELRYGAADAGIAALSVITAVLACC